MPKIKKILELTKEYIEEQDANKSFVAGENYIPVSGATWNDRDIVKTVEVVLSRWFGGTATHEFEKLLAVATRQRSVAMCNSGSSANLLAVSSLTSKEFGKRRLKPGDEVITLACGFPTTVNPIIQNGLVPVFVDINLPQYNALPDIVEEAVTHRTRAVFLTHTLGNPYKAREIRDLCDRNELWHISDNCDSLGAEHHNMALPYWADLSTYSFYPAHHISTMEGGAVSSDNPRIMKIVRSLRDWGRDCWCDPGCDNTCGKRFGWNFDGLPSGYDHKYVFSEIGYNLKSTDMNAALGIHQIMRLNSYIDARQDNWNFYRSAFDELSEFFVLPEPAAYGRPSWFGFMLTVKDKAPFTRNEIVRYLEENKIGTRMLFAGNLTKQPAYKAVKYKVSGTLVKSDRVMSSGFWLGVYQGITTQMREYVMQKVFDFVKMKKEENAKL